MLYPLQALLKLMTKMHEPRALNKPIIFGIWD